jgi:GT2 family glycosyltransferase
MSSVFDFLQLSFAPNPSIARDGHIFEAKSSWAIARFGSIRLPAGWWTFDIEGDADPALTDLRLTSTSGSFVVFRGAHGGIFCVRIAADVDWDANLLISPWPGRIRFRTLRLRRLRVLEEAVFLGKGALRMFSRQRSPGQIYRTLLRLLSGQTVGVRSVDTAVRSAPLSPAAEAPPSSVISTQAGLEVHLLNVDVLHRDALTIAANAFRADPGLEAIYADALEGGVIVARPEWDAELASHTDYVNAPVFFRRAEGQPAWSRLRALSERQGAIARIALPLVRRADSKLRPLPLLPIPVLVNVPSVSIIIPTKTRIDLLEKCFVGLASATDYPSFEVIVMDNGSEHSRLAEVIASARFPVTRVIDNDPFNFSRLNNKGVEAASGEVVLLLNDDIEPIERGWLTRMVASAQRSDVGAVGARLLYPDRTIQHAGVMMGLGGVCGHLWKGRTEDEANRIPQIAYPGTRMAVTAACLAVRRAVYNSFGGLDESFAVAFNDIDFCLRLHKQGLKNIYRGDAVLIHHESQSRGLDDLSAERRRRLAEESTLFLSRWSGFIDADPFGSPAFDPSLQTGAVHPSLLNQ